MASKYWPKIERQMLKRRWRITELAEKSGVKQPTISKWKTTEQGPDVESLRKIARAFGLSVDELLAEPPADAADEEAPVGPVTKREDRVVRAYRGNQTVRTLIDKLIDELGEG